MSNLLEILEEEADLTQNEEVVQKEQDQSNQEWDEMCDILSSQKSTQNGYESPDLFDDSDDSDDIELSSPKKSVKKCEEPIIHTDVQFSSPNNGEKSCEINEIPNFSHPEIEFSISDQVSKRKNSVELDQSQHKKSKLDFSDEDSSFWQNCSIYSRQNTCSPSILNNILSSPEKKNSSDKAGDFELSRPKKTGINDEEAKIHTDFQLSSPDKAEKSPRVNKISNFSESPIPKCETPQFSTPMPDYETMLSPALRQELRKFGLKVIPRPKAVPLLEHIFKETHPNSRRKVEFEEDENEESLSQESNVSDLPEESIIETPVEDPEENYHEELLKFIRKDSDLMRKVLMYEPVWLEDLFQDFKAIFKKVKINQIQEILDNECITFRTRARHEKNSKRNKAAKMYLILCHIARKAKPKISHGRNLTKIEFGVD